MNIFTDYDENLILSQAKESKDRYATGQAKGPLDGVPIVIKDQIDIIGLTVRNGLQHPENRKATTDAEVRVKFSPEIFNL